MSDRVYCEMCEKWVGGGVGCDHYVPAEADEFRETESAEEDEK